MASLGVAEPYAGVFPIAPTPFSDAGDFALDVQRRVLDCRVAQSVDGICHPGEEYERIPRVIGVAEMPTDDLLPRGRK